MTVDESTVLQGLVATTAATATTTLAAAEAAAAAATSTAPGTLFGFVNLEVTAVESLPIELLDGRRGGLIRAHGDEGETAGLTRFAIRGNCDFPDFTSGGEGLLQGFFGGVEGKISYV